MFSLRFTIILLFSLFLPFCLSIFKLEPYPAVLLPSYAIKIKKTDNHVLLANKALFALNNKGNWEQINSKLLLDPIPVQYLPSIMSNDFGFDTDSLKLKSTGFKTFKKFSFIKKTVTRQDEIREIKNWFKKKLIKQGFASSELKIISFSQTISIATGAIEKSKIKYERIISLDE